MCKKHNHFQLQYGSAVSFYLFSFLSLSSWLPSVFLKSLFLFSIGLPVVFSYPLLTTLLVYFVFLLSSAFISPGLFCFLLLTSLLVYFIIFCLLHSWSICYLPCLPLSWSILLSSAYLSLVYFVIFSLISPIYLVLFSLYISLFISISSFYSFPVYFVIFSQSIYLHILLSFHYMFSVYFFLFSPSLPAYFVSCYFVILFCLPLYI